LIDGSANSTAKVIGYHTFSNVTADHTISVTFKPITYTVSYNGNGNTSGSTASSSHTYDVAKALTCNGFTRAYTVTYNYNGNGQANTSATATCTFEGWTTSSDGAKVYNDCQSVINLSSTNGTTVNLYAKWNVGTVTLPTSVRTGYTFAGWYTASSGGTKIGNGGEMYTPIAAITLFAQWTVVSKQSQTITFSTIPEKTYGDAAITLSATSTSKLTVSYASSNTAVATISGSTLTIRGAGVAIITATQSGDATYAAATPVTHTLTVNKAPLTITAENKTRSQGQENPEFTLVYSGFKNGETANVLDVLPTISCAANQTSPAGYYDIVLSGGSDNNYQYTLMNGRLEVTVVTGIEDVESNKISIYPNPTNDELFIISELPIRKVEIYSSTGAMLLFENNFNEKISISTLPQGVYVVKIYTENGLIVSKVVKE